jgi:hypothetical protein
MTDDGPTIPVGPFFFSASGRWMGYNPWRKVAAIPGYSFASGKLFVLKSKQGVGQTADLSAWFTGFERSRGDGNSDL